MTTTVYPNTAEDRDLDYVLAEANSDALDGIVDMRRLFADAHYGQAWLHHALVILAEAKQQRDAADQPTSGEEF